MLILPDNDVGGAVVALRYVLESAEWAELTGLLELRFREFEDLGLARNASDRAVWQTCQAAGAVLITANRAGGAHSLDQVIRDLSTNSSLPVITIADPQRMVRDHAYRQEAAFRLLDYLDRIESLRGTGRLFIP